ncbi:mavicyanin-like [Durio zibethinus]|uniref:Mavicyanin-like n=1 Tax=Durio zibethinus TaxID=66656 RepID=A0A6P6ADT7_DURZI|nr:mavicyanin-like [Durio zibethinus]
MEERIVRYGSLPIILMICFSSLNGTTSEVYTVGDENGWNSEVDYVSWSQKYNFSVGDVLEFKYNKGQHNAFEVTEATYRSCDASSGVLAKYETGDDQVKLTESKKYCFICNVTGHCLGGMRFEIDVKAGNTSNNLEPTPSPNSGSTYAFERWSLGLYLFASAVLFN